MWKALIENQFETFHDYFENEKQRRFYVLSQIEGNAREYIGEQIADPIDPQNQKTAMELVDELYTYLYNPQVREEARDAYLDLEMEDYKTFMDFYRLFQGNARTAKITDEDTLMFDLKNKILDRLRAPTALRYDECTKLTETAFLSMCEQSTYQTTIRELEFDADMRNALTVLFQDNL